jgi:hypothetical protein
MAKVNEKISIFAAEKGLLRTKFTSNITSKLQKPYTL